MWHTVKGSVSKKYAAESRSNWLPETSYYSSNESNNVKASNKDADGDELMFVQAVSLIVLDLCCWLQNPRIISFKGVASR